LKYLGYSRYKRQTCRNSQAPPNPAALEAEVKRLKKAFAVAEMERKIPKKAAAQ